MQRHLPAAEVNQPGTEPAVCGVEGRLSEHGSPRNRAPGPYFAQIIMTHLQGNFDANNIGGIDHAVFAVRDLDAARETFGRMGFTLTPRGHHTVGSQNHCVVFGDDYLELLWLPPDLETRPFIADFLEGGEGLAALALKTGNAEAARAELHAAGLEPSAPMNFARPVHFTGGARDARFRTLDIGAGQVPCGRLFLCEHQTPELVWRPEWQRHENGATAIAAVAVLAKDVAATAPRL